MNSLVIHDPQFREALAALDAGDVAGIERLLAAHPRLVRDRVEGEEGYFRRPYLLWFVAENPIRTGRLPANIAEVTRAILRAAEREGVADRREQIDYALMLVGSGKVARECGVQIALLDVLIEAGADRDGALLPALAHRELAAAERLLEHGARWTLPAAVALGRMGDLERLGSGASPEERQTALAAAAFYGQAPALSLLIDLGVDLDAYGPVGFHPHATALHQAVDSGVLEAVQVLVEGGADLQARDRIYEATPLGWAEYLGREEIAGYLRGPGFRAGWQSRD